MYETKTYYTTYRLNIDRLAKIYYTAFRVSKSYRNKTLILNNRKIPLIYNKKII